MDINMCAALRERQSLNLTPQTIIVVVEIAQRVLCNNCVRPDSSAPSELPAFFNRHPGFRKASTPTPPGLRRGHTIRVYPLKSQSGAP
jgi:hypothetical protein